MQKPTSFSELRGLLDTVQQSKGVKVNLRCGACAFLKRRSPNHAAPCRDEGKSVSSQGCKHFEPDYGRVRTGKKDFVDSTMKVGKLTKGLTEAEIQILAFTLIKAADLRRVTDIVLGEALHVGDTIYVNLSAPHADFLNCWFTAQVGLVSRDKTNIKGHAQLPDGKWVSIDVKLDDTRVLTEEAFKKHAKKLKKKGLINAPARNLQGLLPFIPTDRVESYKPKSIATVQANMQPAPTLVGYAKPKIKTTFKVDTNSDGSRVVTI